MSSGLGGTERGRKLNVTGVRSSGVLFTQEIIWFARNSITVGLTTKSDWTFLVENLKLKDDSAASDFIYDPWFRQYRAWEKRLHWLAMVNCLV
ncbi:hypothetical protein J6590_060778 [Homalodisca vitripennis]|nr:hypothetical protein J6590_060778 [Homalodisca vitripennis]